MVNNLVLLVASVRVAVEILQIGTANNAIANLVMPHGCGSTGRSILNYLKTHDFGQMHGHYLVTTSRGGSLKKPCAPIAAVRRVRDIMRTTRNRWTLSGFAAHAT